MACVPVWGWQAVSRPQRDVAVRQALVRCRRSLWLGIGSPHPRLWHRSSSANAVCTNRLGDLAQLTHPLGACFLFRKNNNNSSSSSSRVNDLIFAKCLGQCFPQSKYNISVLNEIVLLVFTPVSLYCYTFPLLINRKDDVTLGRQTLSLPTFRCQA